MTTQRLTKDMREQATTKVLQDTFSKREKVLLERHKKVSEVIYNEIFKGQVKLIESLPSGFLYETENLTTDLPRSTKASFYNDRLRNKKYAIEMFQEGRL